MTRRGPLALFAWSLLVGALGTLFVPACSENGQTGNCPDLSRYDVNDVDASNSPQLKAERAKSVDAGCMTALAEASIGGSP